MPWLAADDELPGRPTRVLVAGTSGSGKSTLARRIAGLLGAGYFEIDGLYHGPDWTPQPQPRPLVMRRIVRRTVARSLRGTDLWNGNREPPLRTFMSDRDHIVRWAWRSHRDWPARVDACLARRPALVAVRLSSPDEVTRWAHGPLARASARRPARFSDSRGER